jgi:hypothetical protein
MLCGHVYDTQIYICTVYTVYREIITYKKVLLFSTFSLQIQNLSFINNETAFVCYLSKAHTNLFLFSSQQKG